MRYIFSFLVFLSTALALRGQSQAEYEAFKSYFPDFFSENAAGRGLLLPVTDFTRGYLGRGVEFSAEELAAGAVDNMSVVGKIEDYRGFDLFVLDYNYARPDEDSYDNHSSITRFMLVFKDGKLTSRGSMYDSEQVWIPLDQYYYGEGGESDYSSVIQEDTTIVSQMFAAESESSTGFQTPLETRKKWHWRIGKDARPEILHYGYMEFYSPFFLTSYFTGKGLDPSGLSAREYPLKGQNVLWLRVDPSPLLSGNDCRLSFHYEYADGAGYQGVFTLYENDRVSDTYIIGCSSSKKHVLGRNPHLNPKMSCPVVIHTSDGMVEVTPGGRLLPVTAEEAKPAAKRNRHSAK